VRVMVTERHLGPTCEPTLRDLSEALITLVRPPAEEPHGAPGRSDEWSYAGRYLPVRSRCLHPGQQQGRR
jgi:hypothetical protein